MTYNVLPPKNIDTNVAHTSLTIKTTLYQSIKTLRNVNIFCKFNSMKNKYDDNLGN